MNSLTRIFVHGEGDKAWNMAFDEALLRLSTVPVLRCYRWNEPAVSIGYFQSWREAGDRPFVRRYTGGGRVDHKRDFTYTISVPKEHTLDARGTANSYETIHRAVCKALQREGFPAEVTPATDPHPHEACFQRAVKFDVLMNSRKVAGAAQRRSRFGTLHQGSLLLPSTFDWNSLARSLEQELTPLLARDKESSQPTPEEADLIEELVATRYGTDEWNRQR